MEDSRLGKSTTNAINFYNRQIFANGSASITASSVAAEFKNGPMSKNAFNNVLKKSPTTRGFSCIGDI